MGSSIQVEAQIALLGSQLRASTDLKSEPLSHKLHGTRRLLGQNETNWVAAIAHCASCSDIWYASPCVGGTGREAIWYCIDKKHKEQKRKKTQTMARNTNTNTHTQQQQHNTKEHKTNTKQILLTTKQNTKQKRQNRTENTNTKRQNRT